VLFNSLTFVAFFVLVLALHNAPLPWRVKKTNLLLASYIFYAAWNPPFVILLWLSTIVDWHVAKRIFREERLGRRRGLLVISVLLNLGLLGYFKYGGFLLENWAALMSTVGVTWTAPSWSIVLPVGISFYTFQTMAYSLDVYLRRAEPTRSFLDFALFVTFFPQLVAGPIVRPTHLIPQFAKPVRATRNQLIWGLALLTLGLFEKIVLADGALAPAADAVFSAKESLSFTDAWLGTLAFSGQIFSDFAGYSTAAIGIALCLGFSLPNNFKYPMAYLALHLATRLSLYSAGWQPKRKYPRLREPDAHDVDWRLMARGELDICRLGRDAWFVPGRRAISTRTVCGCSIRRQVGISTRRRSSDLFSCKSDLGVFQSSGLSHSVANGAFDAVIVARRQSRLAD